MGAHPRRNRRPNQAEPFCELSAVRYRKLVDRADALHSRLQSRAMAPEARKALEKELGELRVELEEARAKVVAPRGEARESEGES